ncbi:MAG: hypothetical protein ABEI99_00225 [Halobaculum sp.]
MASDDEYDTTVFQRGPDWARELMRKLGFDGPGEEARFTRDYEVDEE